MAEDDSPPADELSAEERLAQRLSDAQLQPATSDISTSAEAIRVLREQGVDAWRAWVAEHETEEQG
jgi:hypothetical protein